MALDENQIFNWDNFEAYAEQTLVDDHAEKQIIETPLGRYVGYASSGGPLTGLLGYFVFDDDCRMIIMDGRWDHRTSFQIRDGHWIRFNFALVASVGMEMNSRALVDVSEYSWRVLNHPADSTVHELIEAGTQTRWVTIICSPQYIEAITGIGLSDMPELNEMVGTGMPEHSIHRDFDIHSRMTSVTSDILRHGYSEGLDLPYAKSRALQLLTMALKELVTPQTPQGIVRLSSQDVNAIHSARAILETEFITPPSVSQLSKRAGINRNKLFYGFKAIVGRSVSDHIKHCRLEHARHLLKDSEMPVGEIATATGFSHQCNFATAFKRQYGEPPSRFRDKQGLASD